MPRADSYLPMTSRARRGWSASGSETVQAAEPFRACVKRPGASRCAATAIRRYPAAWREASASGTVGPAEVR
ncbi:hypothetical protein DRB96_19830 [Streptomyces sp. ICC1]|nr:hypothetical protein DRB89_12950 [Streptomyces sp. ICC4]AWZ14139.1 hypothetical protein DRB96_19830 [Streptomyces sp. ICC1]